MDQRERQALLKIYLINEFPAQKGGYCHGGKTNNRTYDLDPLENPNALRDSPPEEGSDAVD